MPVAAAAIIAGGAIAGSAISSSGAKSAAQTQADAARNASDTQRGMFDTIQQNELPWTQVGGQANSALAQFYGLPGGATTGGSAYAPTAGGGVQRQLTDSSGASTPDYNKILSSLPGYQFQLSQGTQATQRNLAAMGLLNSGAAGKALTQYGQGLAQNYAGQYAGGLATLSQLGQAGAAGVASAGINAANQIGGNQIYAGNAQASGIAGSANAFSSGLQGLVSAYGQYTTDIENRQALSDSIVNQYGGTGTNYTPPPNYLDMQLGGP